MNIKEIREFTGLGPAQFAKKYEIPYRTIHDWETGKSKPPEYVLKLLERVVREDIKNES